MSMLRTVCAAALIAGAFTAPALAADAVSPALAAALKDAGRDPLDIKRDPMMKPGEALAFAGVKPGQAVADLIPGNGYHARILSKLLGPKGNLYPVVPFAGAINAETLRRESKGAPLPVDGIYAVQNVYGYDNMMTIWQDLRLDGGQFAIPKQLDVVWVSGDYSNFHTDVTGKPDMAAVTKVIFASIKPGGVYVVWGAAAAKGAGFGEAEKLGRSDVDAVKAEAEAAGFVLDGESKLLANASDDRTKAANDNSDRFLLRFKKPAGAPKDKRADGVALVKPLYDNTYASGTTGPDGGRRIFFHEDGTYQELGKPGTASPLQEGYWYADAMGRVCILHEYPLPERGYLFCMKLEPRKVGDEWDSVGRRGPSHYKVVQGLWYYD